MLGAPPASINNSDGRSTGISAPDRLLATRVIAHRNSPTANLPSASMSESRNNQWPAEANRPSISNEKFPISVL